MGWRDKVAGTLAGEAAPFAVHPLDERRAWDLLGELRADEATWDEVEAAFRGYLKGRCIRNTDFIDEQIREVERHYRPWLRY